MADTLWNINLQIARQRRNSPRFFQTFNIDIDPNEYVLDAVEKIWAFHDRSLTYRHACHHSTCGACGMLINGIEKLTCITPIHSVTKNGGTLKIKPLRNFPVVSDLVVDTGSLFSKLEQVGFRQVDTLSNTYLPYEKEAHSEEADNLHRLVDCIECGMCISACPVSATDNEYLGPVILAAAQHIGLENLPEELVKQIDSRCGLWRCHSAFECSAICPSNVEPGWRIMKLRQEIIIRRFKNLFKREKK